jgi:uncharacterized membrane protein
VHTLLPHPIFALGLPHGSEWIFVFAFFLFVPTILWIGALISCLKNESSDSTKLAWALVILLTHFIGALIYLLIRRPQRIRELGH